MKLQTSRTLTAAFLSLCLPSLACAAAQWPQFRGPHSSGVSEIDKPPVEFGPGSNLQWKVAVPPGLSCPAVWGDRVFLTAYEDKKLFALCFSRKDGKELWRKEAPAGKLPDVHQVSSPAVATPATDGKRAYVYFSSFGLVAYDCDGKEQWRKPVSVEFIINGSGTSPVLAGGTLLLNGDQEDGKSFLLAVDTSNGATRWQTPRPDCRASYSTPIVWRNGGAEEVVLAGSLRVAGYGLRDGKERWTARVLTSVSVAPSPVVGDGQIYVMSRGVPANAMGTFAGFAEKSDKDGDGKVSRDESPKGFLEGGVFRGIDQNKDGFIDATEWDGLTSLFTKGDSGLFALRAPGEGDITTSHVAWKQTKGVSGITSPLFYQGRVYVVQDGGRVSCFDAKTGKAHFEQERLGAEGEYYASPIAADGRIYFASARGTVAVAEVGDTLKVIARNNLGEAAMATPAIADDKIYVRTTGHLWAFGKTGK